MGAKAIYAYLEQLKKRSSLVGLQLSLEIYTITTAWQLIPETYSFVGHI